MENVRWKYSDHIDPLFTIMDQEQAYHEVCVPQDTEIRLTGTRKCRLISVVPTSVLQGFEATCGRARAAFTSLVLQHSLLGG